MPVPDLRNSGYKWKTAAVRIRLLYREADITNSHTKRVSHSFRLSSACARRTSQSVYFVSTANHDAAFLSLHN
jgi:hypothetical protein